MATLEEGRKFKNYRKFFRGNGERDGKGTQIRI